MTPPVVVDANGEELTNWVSVRVSRSLDNLTGEFSVTAPFDYQKTQAAIAPNSVVKIKEGGELLFTGYAERIETRLTKSDAVVKISGRGLLADLIDASPPPLDFATNTKLITIANAIAAAHNITIKDPLAIAASHEIKSPLAWKPGETAAEALARAATGAETIMLENPAGDLLFWRAEQNQKTRLININETITAAQKIDTAGIFATYTVIGADATKESDGVSATKIGAIATRKNRHLITPAKQADSDLSSCAALADWQQRRAAAQHWTAEILINGWRDESRQLFALGDSIKINGGGDMPTAIITDAEYELTHDRGATATLSLALPAAYTPQPQIDLPADL